MAEQAVRRCPSCGAPITNRDGCRSEVCPTNRETMRPRTSMTDCNTGDRLNSEFQIRENTRTTLHDLVAPDGDDGWVDAIDEMPAQSRVPDFPEGDPPPPHTRAERDLSAPPTRRETPLPRSYSRRKPK